MKSFICINCGKSFTRAYSLKRHQRHNCKKTSNSEKMSEQLSATTSKKQPGFNTSHLKKVVTEQQQQSVSNPKKTAEQQQTLTSNLENTATQQPSASDPEKIKDQLTLKTPSTKKMAKQFTFKIQFKPTWDEMLLGIYNKLLFELKAQKYLLEELYFERFEES